MTSRRCKELSRGTWASNGSRLHSSGMPYGGPLASNAATAWTHRTYAQDFNMVRLVQTATTHRRLADDCRANTLFFPPGIW